MPESLKATIRAAISNAYYDARNAGETMESAADRAATDVMEILEGPPKDDLPGAFPHPGFIEMPDGALMRRPDPGTFDLQDTTSDRPGQ